MVKWSRVQMLNCATAQMLKCANCLVPFLFVSPHKLKCDCKCECECQKKNKKKKKSILPSIHSRCCDDWEDDFERAFLEPEHKSFKDVVEQKTHSNNNNKSAKAKAKAKAKTKAKAKAKAKAKTKKRCFGFFHWMWLPWSTSELEYIQRTGLDGYVQNVGNALQRIATHCTQLAVYIGWYGTTKKRNYG